MEPDRKRWPVTPACRLARVTFRLHFPSHIRVNEAVPEALAMQGVVELLSICPPVKAKLPLAELLFGCMAILNIPTLPFSDNCKVKVLLLPAAPTTVAVATAILSKQLAPMVKFRLEMLTDAVGEAPAIIIIGPSSMLKAKLSIGEGMPPLMLLVMAVAIALKLPVRLLPILERLLPIAPQPASTKTMVADGKARIHMFRID